MQVGLSHSHFLSIKHFTDLETRRQRVIQVLFSSRLKDNVVYVQSSASCNWATVQNVSPVNSSLKTRSNQLSVAVAERVFRQSKMLNYFAYSRLGNHFDCCNSFFNCQCLLTF